MHFNVRVDSEYFVACARIRNLHVNALVQRLLNTIIRDQLVLAILDDDSKVVRAKSEHRFKSDAQPS